MCLVYGMRPLIGSESESPTSVLSVLESSWRQRNRGQETTFATCHSRQLEQNLDMSRITVQNGTTLCPCSAPALVTRSKQIGSVKHYFLG